MKIQKGLQDRYAEQVAIEHEYADFLRSCDELDARHCLTITPTEGETLDKLYADLSAALAVVRFGKFVVRLVADKKHVMVRKIDPAEQAWNRRFMPNSFYPE